MRRLGLALALLVVASTAGCLDDGFAGLWDDLEARDTYTRSTLLETTEPFTTADVLDPMNPPEGPDDFGDRWTTTFDVPQGSTALTVVFKVNFTTPSEEDLPPTPVPPPTSTPRGQVDVFVRGPGGDTDDQNATLERSGVIGLDFRNPAAGQWEVGFNAQGEGEVTVTATGRVPIDTAPES